MAAEGFLGGRTIPAGRTPLFLAGQKSYSPEDLSSALFTHATVGIITGHKEKLFNDIRCQEAWPHESLSSHARYVQGTE